ncbi:MAG: hypothetical protein IPL65_06205 [Lewinellaceae bacterium]|nr:hypothetical protein [Lewinellaceae bacterium]
MHLSIAMVAVLTLAILVLSCKEPAPWNQIKGEYSGNVVCISVGFNPQPDTSYSTATETIDSISQDYLLLKNEVFGYFGNPDNNLDSDTLRYDFYFGIHSGHLIIDRNNNKMWLNRVLSPGNGFSSCTGEYQKQ